MQQKMSSDDNLLRCVSQLLATIEHATIATVTNQGQPWNSPVYFARRGKSLYWTSRHDAQHSQNLRHNPRAFIVIYDSRHEDSTGAALYLEAHVAELGENPAIQAALALIYRRRGKSAPPVALFHEPSPHRVYQATALRAWSNVLHVSDSVSWDERIEVALDDL